MQGTIPMPNTAVGHINPSQLRIPLERLVRSKAILDSAYQPEITPKVLADIKEEMLLAQATLNESNRLYPEQANPTRRATHQAQIDRAKASEIIPRQVPAGQKTSNKPRSYERPHKKNNTPHSERSVRSNDRTSLTAPVATGNPLDIWVMSAPLFRPLPTEEEINEICKMVVMDKPEVVQPRPRQHWSEKMQKVVQATQKEHKKKLLNPPGPPPAPDDVAEYWTRRAAPFPIEDIQRQNSSVMHCLLNAFVDAKPLPKNNEPDTRDFLPTHVLLPKIDFDEYLSHSFEERLELELRSAGLEKPTDGRDCGDSGLFAQEIGQFKEELENIQPSIEKMRLEVISRLPEMHAIEERRINEQSRYLEIKSQMKPDQKRSHKKQ